MTDYWPVVTHGPWAAPWHVRFRVIASTVNPAMDLGHITCSTKRPFFV